MPWPVYSTRFLLHTTAGTRNYTVPAGKRAIVKGISSMNTGAAEQTVYLNIAGATVWSLPVPAGKGVAPPELFLVANGLETVGVVNQNADLRSIVSGYLLESPGSTLKEEIRDELVGDDYDPDAIGPV